LASSASSVGSKRQKVTQETHLCVIQRILRSLASPSSLSHIPEPSSAGVVHKPMVCLYTIAVIGN
jgi:hypothetical protein